MSTVPALPPPAGPNAAKAKFFAEAAAAFELMSLFYTMTPEEQADLRNYIAGLAAEVTAREMKSQKGKQT